MGDPLGPTSWAGPLRKSRRRKAQAPELIQEESGIHVAISGDLERAARHSADTMHAQYSNWLQRDRLAGWGHYKRTYFTVAVGGGTTGPRIDPPKRQICCGAGIGPRDPLFAR
jgi:hypothetical protein